MHVSDPVFPPVYRPIAVKRPLDPTTAAAEALQDGSAEAGDIYWARRTDAAECAIVLQPDCPTENALQASTIAMVAIGDALGAIGPPNLAITYAWPETILANGARVGLVRLLVNHPVTPGAIINQMVLSMKIFLQLESQPGEPGEHADETALWEEGCGDVDRTQLLEAFSRHFLSWMERWENDGFGPIHSAWTFRMHEDSRFAGGPNALACEKILGLDETGNLLVKVHGTTIALSLLDHAGSLAECIE